VAREDCVAESKRFPIDRAVLYSEQFVQLVRDACERILPTGAIRRRQGTITQLEFLAIPKLVEVRDLLAEATDRLLQSERVSIPLGRKLKDVWHAHRRSGLYRTGGGALIPFTLQWATPETWAVQLALSTVNDGLAMAMTTRRGSITPRGRAGMLPSEYRVYGGRVLEYATGAHVPTPAEDDFLRLIYGDAIPAPSDRR
jgi:hypothetical protein